jgi:hypothetical protein
MHGGARGSGGPQGDRNGNFKHGVWTREMSRSTASTVRPPRLSVPSAMK